MLRPRRRPQSTPAPFRRRRSDWLERLITHPNADAVVVEQYRKLAAILHHSQMERGDKVVMVASAQPQRARR